MGISSDSYKHAGKTWRAEKNFTLVSFFSRSAEIRRDTAVIECIARTTRPVFGRAATSSRDAGRVERAPRSL